MAALIDKAKRAKAASAPAAPQTDEGGQFKKPNVAQFIPPGMTDIVQRTTAAAVKLMYSPQMRSTLQEQVQAPGEVASKIADNATGLLLTLDQKVKGGIPVAALFPTAVDIAGECATVLTTAGVDVSQEDFNNALLALYVQIGKKLGGTDDQLMHGAQQAAGVPPEGGTDEGADLPPGAAQAAAAAGAPQGQPPPAGPVAPVAPPGAPLVRRM